MFPTSACPKCNEILVNTTLCLGPKCLPYLDIEVKTNTNKVHSITWEGDRVTGTSHKEVLSNFLESLDRAEYPLVRVLMRQAHFLLNVAISVLRDQDKVMKVFSSMILELQNQDLPAEKVIVGKDLFQHLPADCVESSKVLGVQLLVSEDIPPRMVRVETGNEYGNKVVSCEVSEQWEIQDLKHE